MVRRHVMIGTGPAAVSAAESIRSVDDTAEIVMIGAEPEGYYSRPGLAYYLAKEIPERALHPFTGSDFGRLNAQLLVERAVGIDADAHRVVLADGRGLTYDRLLVATGSLAVPIHVPGAELDGVVKLDDIADARDLIRRSRRGGVAVVVGGGITALEMVEGLRARGVHVHYLMRKDRYWSNVLSQSESQTIERGLVARGVEIHYFTELARILGHDGRVAGVETQDGDRIPCNLVGVAIGVLPRKELAEDAGLKCGRGILVDSHLRSSDEDIFAAGDLAEVRDPATDGARLEVLWNSAVLKGRVAGFNMAAESARTYTSAIPLNITRLAGRKVTIIGTVGGGEGSDLEALSRGDSENWRELGSAVEVERQTGDASIRLALKERTIAGAVVMGDQALSFPLQDLVETRADVSDIFASLQEPNAPLIDLVQDFWQDWKVSRA